MQAHLAASKRKLKLRHRFVQDAQDGEGILLFGPDGERAVMHLSQAAIFDADIRESSPWSGFMEELCTSTNADYRKLDLSYDQDDTPEPS